METEGEAAATLGENRSEWPEVAIIVLNWNNYEDTAVCLESLEDIDYPNYRVYVVDNGSTDGSSDKLQEEFGWCRFILNENNLGFARGCNRGIREAYENSDYILLLNNDTIVENNFLTPLVVASESNNDVAITSGVIYEAGSNEIWFAGGEFNSDFISLSVTKEPPSTISETQFITGAMMLLSSDFLQSNGMLNDEYFFGMEDQEISYLALENNWKLVVVPDSTAMHKVGASSGDSQTAFRRYHSTRNRLIFSSNNHTTSQAILYYIYFIITRVKEIARLSAKGELKKSKSIILAVYDYINNKKPKTIGQI